MQRQREKDRNKAKKRDKISGGCDSCRGVLNQRENDRNKENKRDKIVRRERTKSEGEAERERETKKTAQGQ